MSAKIRGNKRLPSCKTGCGRGSGAAPQVATACISTGCGALDAALPDRGIRPGSLVEWIEDGAASGAGTLALLVGRQFCQPGRPAIVVDLQRQIYPRALSACGFDLSTLILVRPRSEQETLWACEECLRCRAVALVWARIEHLPGIAFRRLQLAAEESGGVGFFVRPAAAIKQPSWAEVRLLVTPRPTREASPCFRVEVAYSRGKTRQAAVDIAIDALRGTLHDAIAEKGTVSVNDYEPFAENPTNRLSLVS